MHGLKSLTPPIGFLEPRKFFATPSTSLPPHFHLPPPFTLHLHFPSFSLLPPATFPLSTFFPLPPTPLTLSPSLSLPPPSPPPSLHLACLASHYPSYPNTLNSTLLPPPSPSLYTYSLHLLPSTSLLSSLATLNTHPSPTSLLPTSLLPPLPIPLPSPYPPSYPSTGVLILEITSRLSIASLTPPLLSGRSHQDHSLAHRCVCGHLLFTSGFLSLNSVVFFLLKLKKHELSLSFCV